MKLRTGKRLSRTVYESVAAFCGTVIVVTFSSFLVSSVRTAFTWESRLFPLLAILCVLVPPFLFRLLRCRRLVLALRAVYLCGMLLFVLSFGALAAVALRDGGEPDEAPTAVLVFGCKTAGTAPGREMKLRLDTALSVLAEYPGVPCIVSGGQGDDEPVTEASVMRRYLLEHGIAGERILTEENARNTKGNLSFSFALMQAEGIDTARVLCISGIYHLPRIRWLSAVLAEPVTTYAAPVAWYDILPDLGREYMAFVKALLTT